MLEKRVAVLRRFAALKDVPDRVVTDIARHSRWFTEPPGKEIYSTKSDVNGIYFLAEGRIKVTLYSRDGRFVLFSVSGPYEMFGEIAAIDGLARSTIVEVEEASTLGLLPIEQFRSLVAKYPDFALAIMKQLARDIRNLSQRIYELSTLDVQTRVYAELVRQIRSDGVTDGQTVLSPAPPLGYVAAMVSTRREAVSRAILALAKQGIVLREGKDLRILDVARLKKIVDETRGELP